MLVLAAMTAKQGVRFNSSYRPRNKKKLPLIKKEVVIYFRRQTCQ